MPTMSNRVNKVMHMSLRTKRKHKKAKHNPNHKKVFDNECLEAKILMRKYATLLTKTHSIGTIRNISSFVGRKREISKTAL